MATLFRPDGTRTEVQPANENIGFSLKEVQALVGGDVVPTTVAGQAVLCDLDGLHKQLPVNPFFPSLVGNVLTVKGIRSWR
jgi:hypothetical protein